MRQGSVKVQTMYHKRWSISQKIRAQALCVLCQHITIPHDVVCRTCQQHFKPLRHHCRHCAQPLPDNIYNVCGVCLKQKPLIDKINVPYCYEEPLRTLIHDYKYQGGLYLAQFLARLILPALDHECLTTECLLPVPLHRKRLYERGYNQSALLTLHLAKTLAIPFDLQYGKKILNTRPQAQLNARERQQNLRQAFTVKAIPYQHVTLIDDLITTGSTTQALARLLKQQGVKRVDLWCCARAAPASIKSA